MEKEPFHRLFFPGFFVVCCFCECLPNLALDATAKRHALWPVLEPELWLCRLVAVVLRHRANMALNDEVVAGADALEHRVQQVGRAEKVMDTSPGNAGVQV